MARIAECHPDKKHFAKGKCKNCYMQSFREARPEYREENKRVSKDWRYRTQYGMSSADVSNLLASQSSKCACCGKAISGSSVRVDHCHATGYVRGLLCHECNTGIGLLGDNLDGLLKAVRYLQQPLTAFKGSA